ncbi:MAG: HAMP domain-containing sensor histidine kinase [Nocardioides sp.]
MKVEPPGSANRGRVSVRARLVTVVAVLTGLAFTGAGLLVYTLESAFIENAVNAQIEQEVAEFRRLEAEGVDPETTRPFTDVGGLIRLFLSRNVPDDDEMLVGYVEDEVRITSAAPSHPELSEDPDFLDLIERRLIEGGSDRLDEPYGEVIVTVVPVRNSETRGALVIANFLEDEHQELDRVIQTYLIVAASLLLLITGVAAWQAGRLLSPIRTLRETAEDISETDLSRRIPETGNDDITALTRTVNQMLARLEGAFTGQRQFLDDAGHELKTPLTVLQGHLELMDHTDPAEVTATTALLLDEIDRMSRLVNELITLAKSDRPDYYRFAPTHLPPYLDTVLEKCRALGPRTWVLDESADDVASIDQQRITQALLQLAQNAVKHTGEADEIGLGTHVDAEHGLRLWVRDSGRGVDDEAKSRIFDRFSRSRVREDDEGFGLGLSIVAAIVRAHGGSVSVTDAPGRGAVFTLTLPLRRKDEPWPGS